MDLFLSIEDRTRLRKATKVLLSPLSYEGVDAWRKAVNEALICLLGADQALFILPLHNEDFAYSADLSPHLVGAVDDLYTEEVDRLLRRSGHELWQRAVTFEVHDDRLLWEPVWEDYQQSAYFQEWKRPHGLHNTAGMSTSLDEQSPGALSTCQALVYRAEPHLRPYGQRELMLLHLLFPAFRAGIQTLRRLREHRTTLFRTLDATGQMLQLFDLHGRLLHATPSLSEALQQDPAHPRLQHAMSRTADALGQLGRASGRDEMLGPAACRTVVTDRACYQLHGSYVGPSRTDEERLVLVSVQRQEDQLPPKEVLRERFGLTRRQAEVAFLLAERKRNREIADLLGISEHTVRRHTEGVLSKLDIHSRDEVRHRLSP